MSVLIRARAARTGPQDYPEGTEHRDASEVFAPESMATWVGAPVTIGHPGTLTAESVADHAIGYVRRAWRDRGDGDGVEFVGVEMVVFRADDARGLTELSAGYSVNLVNRRQTDIRVNHVGLFPEGYVRCGSACSVSP